MMLKKINKSINGKNNHLPNNQGTNNNNSSFTSKTFLT